MEPRTILIYGDTKIGKTTEVYRLVKYLLGKWKKEGKKKIARLVNTDGGGSMNYFDDSGLTKAGYVQGIDISNSNILHLESQVIADGRWPVDSIYKGAETDWYPVDLDWIEENIGVYILEGFDSLCNRWASHMSAKMGKGGKKEGFALPAVYEEEDEGGKLKGELFRISGLDQGHYGMIQKELETFWNKQFRRLPVEYIIVTSLCTKGKDKFKRSCYGPSSVGVAQVGQIPQWFSDCWYMEKMSFQTDNGIVGKRVAWFESHLDPETECEYPAGFRTMPEDLEERDKKFPGGYIICDPKGQGIVDMYKWREGRTK